MPRQFMVASRNPAATPEDVQAAVQSILEAVPGSSMVKPVHPETRVAVIDLPTGAEDAAQAALGAGFVLEPNATLEPLSRSGPETRCAAIKKKPMSETKAGTSRDSASKKAGATWSWSTSAAAWRHRPTARRPSRRWRPRRRPPSACPSRCRTPRAAGGQVPGHGIRPRACPGGHGRTGAVHSRLLRQHAERHHRPLRQAVRRPLGTLGAEPPAHPRRAEHRHARAAERVPARRLRWAALQRLGRALDGPGPAGRPTDRPGLQGGDHRLRLRQHAPEPDPRADRPGLHQPRRPGQPRPANVDAGHDEPRNPLRRHHIG